ncbi:MFS transporter [Microlunatus endophyticus]|uniref:Putative proline/betaine transporter n=1 Tax=Microlunatus endophyticus TaxID=1716077 RepID=A0A917S3E6_9ACTN|nr:MFS transporter [Microlunatus endophyticus]GGL50564.1 MFS transporter [Microlunatus endophyticus]
MSPAAPGSTNQAIADASPPILRRAIAAAAVGNFTEWFDYGVYSVVATYIAKALAPGDSIAVTLGAFAISFLIRPIGGLVWGPLGDRIGRRRVLATTILLMAGSTFCVGLIPSYAKIGWIATLLLYLLRMIQGFSTGGEYGGAATFMAEYSPDRKRGFFGSFLEFGTLSGFAGGSLVTLALQLSTSGSFMQTWGWRIPFFVALPLGLIGLYLRSRLDETPAFRDLDEKGQTEEKATTALKDLVTGYWRPILTLSGLVIALNVVNYTLLSYMPTYVQTRLGLSETQALVLASVGQLFMMCFLPLSGALSDRVGRKPLWLFSMIGLFVVAIPMYLIMPINFGLTIVAFMVLGLLYVPQLSTISATFPAMFPTQVRYAGFAIGYNIATSLFGGTAPLINDAMISWTKIDIFPAFFMMAACVVGVIAWFSMKETAGASLRGTKIPETTRSKSGKIISADAS